MLNGHAEAQSFYVIQIRGVTVEAVQNMIGALFGNSPVDGIYIAQFGFVITATDPMQFAQIHSIGYAEILEGTEQLAVNGFRQADIRRNASSKIVEDNELIRIRNLGKKSMCEIKTTILDLGFQDLTENEKLRFFETLLTLNPEITERLMKETL